MDHSDELRRETRFSANQIVVVTPLRHPENRMAGRITNFSGRGLGLETPSAILPGTALTITLEDSMIFGEAVYCREESGYCFIGVELNQVLAGLAELGRCLQEFAPVSIQSVDSADYSHA